DLMSQNARQFDGRPKVQLLALAKIEIAVSNVEIAGTHDASAEAKQNLRLLRRRRRLDNLAEQRPELGEFVAAHRARVGHESASRSPQPRAALSRSFGAWIASRAAFHSESPQRRNS